MPVKKLSGKRSAAPPRPRRQVARLRTGGCRSALRRQTCWRHRFPRGERHAAEDGADVDDQAIGFWRWREHGPGDAREPTTLVSKTTFACSAVKASVRRRPDAGVVDQHVDLPASVSTILTPASTDASSLTSNSTVLMLSFRSASAAYPVLTLRTPHRGVPGGQRGQGLPAMSRPNPLLAPGDQDCFGHTRSP